MNVYPFIEAEKAQQRNVKRACHASTPCCAAPGTTTAVSAWPG